MWFSNDFEVYFIRKGELTPHFGPFPVWDRGTSLKLKVKGTKVFSNIVYSICTHDSQRQQRSMSVFGLLVGGGGSRPLILGISSHIFRKTQNRILPTRKNGSLYVVSKALQKSSFIFARFFHRKIFLFMTSFLVQWKIKQLWPRKKFAEVKFLTRNFAEILQSR